MKQLILTQINLKANKEFYSDKKGANNAQFTKILRQKDLIKMDYY